MAAAPWLVWALRKGLRGEGSGYLAVSGLFAGFAVLMQAEYAIGLALLCACLLAVELGRVGTGRNDAGVGRLLGRAAAVVAVALGSIAYWLLPFISLGKSFILSPGRAGAGRAVQRQRGAGGQRARRVLRPQRGPVGRGGVQPPGPAPAVLLPRLGRAWP